MTRKGDGYPFIIAALVVCVGLTVVTKQTSRWAKISAMRDDPKAKSAFEALLKERKIVGRNVLDAVKALRSMGFACEILPRFAGFYYCTLDEAAPGLPGRFVAREWKVLVPFDQEAKATGFQVNVGRTGP